MKLAMAPRRLLIASRRIWLKEKRATVVTEENAQECMQLATEGLGSFVRTADGVRFHPSPAGLEWARSFSED